MEAKGKMGLASIILLGFNGIIGTGIFLLPNKAMALIGPASLLVILFDALLVISLALCFAEAGSMFKKNGGPYIYAREAFGEFVGFEVGIMKWAISIIAWAAMVAGFSTALASIIPFFAEPLPKTILIISIVLILSIVNILGIKMSKILNNIVTTGKLIPLVIFIAIGLFFIKGENFTPFLVPGINNGVPLTTIAAFSSAALVIFYAFTGFESIAVAAEDMESPEKNIPRAIIIVITIVSVTYLLIQVISIGVLGASLAQTATPVQTAFEKMIGGVGKYLVAAGTLISIGGINIAASILTPRSGSALAEDGLIPRSIANKNRYNAPYVSIIVSGILTLVLALSGSFTTLAAISVISRFAQYLPTCIAIIVLRKRPDLKRTFTVPFGPVIPIIATAISCWLLYFSDLKKIIIGLGGLVIGAIYYGIVKLVAKVKN